MLSRSATFIHLIYTDDPDGNVNFVSRTAGSPTPLVVSYTYGSSGIKNGVPTQVVDGLTNVTQNIDYQTNPALPGYGQVASVNQFGGLSPSYNVYYGYTASGDRSTANYVTANGSITWKYSDYAPVGSFEQNKRAFQTLNKLDSSGNSTAEEMHYQFDTAGRLRESAFAQSPQTGSGAPSAAPYYTASYPAASRVISFNDFDGGGRQVDLQNGYQVWGGSSYNATQCLVRNSCAYDLTKNLKTSSSFYGPASGAPTTWTTSPRVETYGYDSALDFLTSANYNDGLANASPTWSYDAAANRTDSVCDNLNRTTSIGGVTTMTDTLGNRLTLGSSTSYSWDALNRMTSLTKSGTTTNYEYRADGMRTHKLVGSVATEYVHDGQMPVEDSVINGSTLTVTRYGLLRAVVLNLRPSGRLRGGPSQPC